MAAPEDPSDDARLLDSPPQSTSDPTKPSPTLVAADRQPQPAASSNSSSAAAAAPHPDPVKKPAPLALTPAQVLRASSPKSSSRETSPTRPRPPRLAQGGAARLSRSRKNSQDLSPSRSANLPAPTLPDAPSAAAVQRALSATGLPRVALPGDAAGDAPRQQRASRAPNSATSPTAANTSRVKSPPRSVPAAKPGAAPRKLDPAPPPPDIAIDSPTPPQQQPVQPPPHPPAASAQSFFEAAEQEESSGTRNSIRSPIKLNTTQKTLEAVQESTSPETPAIASATSNSSSRSRNPAPSPPSDLSQKDAPESGSEGSSIKKPSGQEAQDDSMKLAQLQATPRLATLQPQKSFSSLSNSKNKAGDGSVRSMTVETETVPSIPQLAVGANSTERGGGSKSDGGGTVRVKPSNETIRPKKEKKKTVRKAAAAASGTSSKADIFEAKVASAVDEADSSDSGETFVYESNPPEPAPRVAPRHHHSRTPSATSMASQADAHGRLRSEAHNSIMGKKSMKSMKFANSFHNLADLPTDDDSQSARHSVGNGTHHIGRWGRNGGHASILSGDAPFAATPARAHPSSQVRHSSRPNTPRNANFLRSAASGKAYVYHNDVDDDEEAADDERTPLIHPAHAGRNRHSRRLGARTSNRALRQDGNVFKGVCAWILLALLITVLVAAVIVALVLCSKPLREVHIGEISNVIASEEEVVFDLKMFALNPNIVSIQVESLDMKVFAKSEYVGSTARRPAEVRGDDWWNPGGGGGVDEGTDPIEEPGGSDTMMLAHVYALDSPLSFAPSPFSHDRAHDVGEISFSKPGNRTADDGTERWKTVVQHSFELIVVGQLKYTLPISSKTHSVSVGQGKTTVEPGKAKAGAGEGLARPPMPGPVKVVHVARFRREFAA